MNSYSIFSLTYSPKQEPGGLLSSNRSYPKLRNGRSALLIPMDHGCKLCSHKPGSMRDSVSLRPRRVHRSNVLAELDSRSRELKIMDIQFERSQLRLRR